MIHTPLTGLTGALGMGVKELVRMTPRTWMIEIFIELGNHGRPGLEIIYPVVLPLKTDRLKSTPVPLNVGQGEDLVSLWVKECDFVYRVKMRSLGWTLIQSDSMFF